MRAFQINGLCIGFNDIGCHIACDVKDALIVLDGILIIYGSIFKLVFVCIVALFEINDALHQRMVQVERYLRMVGIVICHSCFKSLIPVPSPRGGGE